MFDEVDAGVGGSTARSLAQVLADLARTHQVIVVDASGAGGRAGLRPLRGAPQRRCGGHPRDEPHPRRGRRSQLTEIARLLSGDATERVPRPRQATPFEPKQL
ncbi:MAG: hypothetical protein ACLTSX_14330 [Collinsella sp.]